MLLGGCFKVCHAKHIAQYQFHTVLTHLLIEYIFLIIMDLIQPYRIILRFGCQISFSFPILYPTYQVCPIYSLDAHLLITTFIDRQG